MQSRLILAPDLFLGIIFAIGLLAGLVLLVSGIYFVATGASGEAKIKFFGQELNASNAGLATAFLGAVIIGLIVVRAPGSLIQLVNVVQAPQASTASKPITVKVEAAQTQVQAPIPAQGQKNATLITRRFAEAGFGRVQQIAAVANAIAESNLNSNARSTGQGFDSVGLFQLNRMGGLGTGYTVEQLTDPERNIALVVAVASKYEAFKKAATLKDAVAEFVTKISRPANLNAEIQKQLQIAQLLV